MYLWLKAAHVVSVLLFVGGTPEKAEPQVLQVFEAMTAGMDTETDAAVARIAEKRAA